jgi:F0F1-type ATP synthase membrane subunit c/vacuolar-type H+-ATPase subunit K
MDVRYAGIASGVGQGEILGKVLNAVMKMGSSFFPISVTVL